MSCGIADIEGKLIYCPIYTIKFPLEIHGFFVFVNVRSTPNAIFWLSHSSTQKPPPLLGAIPGRRFSLRSYRLLKTLFTDKIIKSI